MECLKGGYIFKWRSWVGTSESWNHLLLDTSNYAVFQSFGWGEYKKSAGWKTERYCCKDEDGKIFGMAQALVRTLPFGMAFIWIPGGPVFNLLGSKNIEAAEISYRLICKIIEDYPRSLIRLNSHLENDNNLSHEFNKLFLRPYVQLNSGSSIRIRLNHSVGMMRSSMTSKHRYYTKKAGEKGISWVVGNTDKHLVILDSMYREMVEYKKLPYNVSNLEELFNLRENMGSCLLGLTGFLGEIPVASCLVLLFGKKAFYMTASTSKLGREISASYAMFEQLMQQLAGRGISDFDFGGIDLGNKSAAGVNHFKNGFGGEVVEYLGEWESASSSIVRLAINLAIRLKVGR